MKRGIGFIFIFGLVLFMPFVFAGFFGDIYNGITGKVIDNFCTTGTGVEIPQGKEVCACGSTILFNCNNGNFDRINDNADCSVKGRLNHCIVPHTFEYVDGVTEQNYWDKKSELRDKNTFTTSDSIIRSVDGFIGASGMNCQEVVREDGLRGGDCSNPPINYGNLAERTDWKYGGKDGHSVWIKQTKIADASNLLEGGKFTQFYYNPDTKQTVSNSLP